MPKSIIHAGLRGFGLSDTVSKTFQTAKRIPGCYIYNGNSILFSENGNIIWHICSLVDYIQVNLYITPAFKTVAVYDVMFDRDEKITTSFLAERN